jgi:hypothetical protein
LEFSRRTDSCLFLTLSYGFGLRTIANVQTVRSPEQTQSIQSNHSEPMKDEDTGEDIPCPWCEAVGDCPHRLALIDLTFGQCDGGYAFDRWSEALTAVEDGLRFILKNRRISKAKQLSWTLRNMLTYAREDFDRKSDWISIDGSAFTRLMVESLTEAGGQEYEGSIVDEGGPGASSAMALLHAEDPKAVFEAALTDLSEVLDV